MTARSAIRLVVGLGNPGAEYAKTRHNAGFWFCERLAETLAIPLAHESRFHGRVGRLRQPDADLWLLLPSTYMNRSGIAVRALMQFYRIEPAEMLVVHDELDLPPGFLRLKYGGGLGGHNGLKDITSHLGTQDYWRLRIGIGHPGDKNAVIEYVLKPPRPEERAAIESALVRALEGWPLILRGDFPSAMQLINRKPALAKDMP
ncbi:MAG: aminoacyl-tRNA hydrolase [Rhodocyclaceae bacterium]|nr:aminoacyl-tRNA hydrolase [Rhodocyclaceae bacterium]